MGARWGVALGAAAAMLVLGAGEARAQQDPAFPAATCAALWTAHARSPLGPGADPLGFREEAVRRSGDVEAVDAFIATETMQLTDLIYAYIELADDQSREVFEGLLDTCDRFARTTPQIAAPQEGATKGSPVEPSG
jgi:hypothetical protein